MRFSIVFSVLSAAFISCSGVDIQVNYRLFKEIDSTRSIETFPYNEFLNQDGVENPATIRRYKQAMDSIGLPGTRILVRALTTETMKKDSARLAAFDLNYLLSRLTLGERYTDVGEFYTEDPIIYKAIGDSWLDVVADKLADTIKRNKYIEGNLLITSMLYRLNEYRHNPESLPASDYEKAFYNIRNGRWAYLMDRFETIGTGLKLLVFAFVVIIIAQQIIFFNYLFKLLTKIRERK